jgi:hypothetical protein
MTKGFRKKMTTGVIFFLNRYVLHCLLLCFDMNGRIQLAERRIASLKAKGALFIEREAQERLRNGTQKDVVLGKEEAYGPVMWLC